MTATPHAKIAAKMHALLQKTVAHGCTEAEALSAAEMFVKLQAEYKITLSDIELLADPVNEYSFDRADALSFLPEDYCVEGISELCGVKIWHVKRDEKTLFTNDVHKVRLLSILGVESDVKFAHWLYEMIASAISSSFSTFANTIIYKRNPNQLDAANSFKLGMAVRINTRLRELAGQAETVVSATGTDVAVIRNQKLDAALKQRNYTFNAVQAVDKLSDEKARQQGMAAADSVNLNRPLENRRPRVRLDG